MRFEIKTKNSCVKDIFSFYFKAHNPIIMLYKIKN